MADAYVVTAPYVVPKVRDNATGALVHRGYYRDATIRAEDIDPESLRHHLDSGMMAECQPAPAAEVAPPAGEVAPDGAPTQPRQSDPKEAWVAYAVALRPEGQSEQDARAEAEAMTKADLVATLGG